MLHRKLFAPLLVLFVFGLARGSECEFTIARLQYEGGGDWYANPSSLPNLAEAAGKRLPGVSLCDTVATVQISDELLHRYPFIYMTGHGNVRFSHDERLRLRTYLVNGGFLWADDNYGLNKSFRREMKALFPENPLVPVPLDHPIYRSVYDLPGPPKIHEHDGEPAQGLGIFFDDRLVVFYTYSADIGDGMEDLHIHNDGPKLHEAALRMGINVLGWFLQPLPQ